MSVTAFLLLAAQAGLAQPIDGKWVNPANSVIIAIGPCGDQRCGVVEWASVAAQADARKNAPALVGTALLTGLTPVGATSWRGRIFVPDRNIRARARITMVGADQINVRGCALGGLLCDSQTWTRTNGPLPPPN